ncbi:MAG: MFS transporter, partial [Candidatus Woesearchaeota archaeon]
MTEKISSNFSSLQYRWIALVFITLGLAIVVIDNTILNISIPYMLKDLGTDLRSLQWVISGYSLTIATILITVGRIGDIFGRKKMFITGMVVFAIGSFISSLAPNVTILLLSKTLIMAVGAAMTLTSALALVADTFQGRERAIAFGVWGSVAGAAATIGPLLGGFLTTYASWRWSLRLNLFVSLIAVTGSIFITEKKTKNIRKFDWIGVFLSGAGLFLLVFGFIEARKYGWWWPLQESGLPISITPIILATSVLILGLFVVHERKLERKGVSPLLTMSAFANKGFSIGLLLLLIMTFGLFGIFFLLPIYFQNVLGYSAFKAGIVLLPWSVSLLVFGFVSGFLAARINLKWIVTGGFVILGIGIFSLTRFIGLSATPLSVAPSLIVIGLGFGLCTAQLNNVVISSAPFEMAGEASAASMTMRQIGAGTGVAVLGAIFASVFLTGLFAAVSTDSTIPNQEKASIIENLKDIQAGQLQHTMTSMPYAEA